MATLFELGCCEQTPGSDWQDFCELARRSGWTIAGVQTIATGYNNVSQWVHRRFLCDHDWREAKALIRVQDLALPLMGTIMPLNIYDGQQRSLAAEMA